MSGIVVVKTAKELPLQKISTCAEALGYSVKGLVALAEASSRSYRPFTKRKADGGSREIDRPIGALKIVQGRIADRLLSQCRISNVAYGGVKKRDCFQAAGCHVQQKLVGKLDIKAFFPSVTSFHVYRSFVAVGCSPNVARILTQLTTFKGHLPQGSPASTALANLVLREIDEKLSALAGPIGVAVTRVVDDITFSGPPTAVRRMLDVGIREIHALGLRVNRKKIELMPSYRRQEVNGLTVNSKKVSVPKTYQVRLRTSVRLSMKKGVSDKERSSLRGRAQHLRRTSPTRANKLLQIVEALPRL